MTAGPNRGRDRRQRGHRARDRSADRLQRIGRELGASTTNTAVTGATFDIDSGQQLVEC